MDKYNINKFFLVILFLTIIVLPVSAGTYNYNFYPSTDGQTSYNNNNHWYILTATSGSPSSTGTTLIAQYRSECDSNANYGARAHFIFDTSSLPDNKAVGYVYLSLYGSRTTYYEGDAFWYAFVHDSDEIYPHNVLEGSDYSRYNYDMIDGSTHNFISTSYSHARKSLSFNNIGRTWVRTDNYTRFTMMVQRDFQMNTPGYCLDNTPWYTYEEGTTYSPILYVVMEDIPTAPASFTNGTVGYTYIPTTWTDPSDISKISIFVNGQFLTNVTAGVQAYNFTGLTPSQDYTLSIRGIASTYGTPGVWSNITKSTNKKPWNVSFVADDTTVEPNVYIHFYGYGSSIGTIAWNWSFGDGSYSNLQNPSHKYTSEGYYTVSLNVSDEYGSEVYAISNYVQIGYFPVADFTSDVTAGTVATIFHFVDQSTSDVTLTSWTWYFGDGSTSTVSNPVHSYSSPGNYSVSLKITNKYGFDWENKTDYITIYGEGTPTPTPTGTPTPTPTPTGTGTPTPTPTAGAPTAAFSVNITEGLVPLIVRFTDSSTNSPTAWNWTFGDGLFSESQNPAHIYSSAGSYTVILIATNGYGSDSETKSGYILVTSVLKFPSRNYYPTDQNSNGYYEDINGDGAFTSMDTLLFFHNFLWVKSTQPVARFDFNSNARLDFDDIVKLSKLGSGA